MTDLPPSEENRDQLFEEASRWFGVMRGENAEAHRPDFERWLKRGAAHLGAYNRAASVFNELGFLGEPDERQALEDLIARNTAADDGPAKDSGPRRRRWPLIAGVAGLAVAAILAVMILVRPAPMFTGARPELAVPRSAGDTRIRLAATAAAPQTFALADGSKVTLAGGSALLVDFSKETRTLRLLNGRGRFDVAHEARPFIVLARRGSVTARGTLFDVAIDAQNRVSVQLLRGAIDVAIPQGSRRSVQRLAPGQKVDFADAATTSATNPSPVRAVADPGDGPGGGVQVYDDTRVGEIVAQANRTAQVPIVVVDQTVAGLRVSGRFRLADTETVAKRLAALLGLSIDRSVPDRIILRR